MKSKKIIAGILAAAITLSSFTVNGFAETSLNESNASVADDSESTADDTSTELVNIAITGPGKTVIDNGLVRTNIINPWAGDDDAIIADGKSFKNAKEVTVKFSVSNYTSAFSAWISLASYDFNTQYWGEKDDGNCNATGTTVDVTGNGEYEVTAAFDYAIDGMGFMALCTSFPADDADSNIPTLAIESISAVIDLSVPSEPTPGDASGEIEEPDEPCPGDSSGDVPEPGEDESDYTYSVLDDGTIEITGYNGSEENVDVPPEIDGKSVTRIGESAFYNCSNLTSVTLPDGVTSIDIQAFEFCENLTNVTLPDSLISIGNWAFNCCYRLTSITIPHSVTSIGESAFNGCSSFKFIDVASENSNYISVNGVLFNKDKTELKCYPAGKTDESYVFPDNVIAISAFAFSSCEHLTSIAIPDSVIYVDSYAFYNCTSLKTVVIPASVEYIEFEAFYNCSSLKEVTIPASVKFISDEAFGYYYDMKVDGFKINYVNNTWGHWYATKNGFSDEACLVTNELDDGTLEIDRYAGNSATYEIPAEIGGKKVTGIKSNAFSGCTELTSVTIPDSVTYIDYSAFYNCTSLKEVTIPASVNFINDIAFGYYSDDNFDTRKIDNFKIYCYAGTAGEQYAKDNGFDYELLECKEHKFGDWKITKAATCTATGTQTGICSVCGKTETQTIPALGHKYSTTWTTDKAATCGTAGSKSHHCTRCSAKSDVTAIPATGKHDFNDWTITKAETYTATGTKTRTCKVCKKTETATIAKRTLAKVGGFKAKAKDSTSITLQWNKNSSASGYIIEAYNGKTWVQVTKIAKNSTLTYKVTKLSASKTYQYRIKAYKTEGKSTAYSAYSATLSVNTNPTNISGFKAKAKSYNSITLQWNKNASATGYELQKWDGKKWVTLTKIAKNSTTTYTVKGLKASTTYKYRIRAYKTIGKATQYSAYSATLSVNTNPTNMSGYKVKSKTATSVTLLWNKNASATGYELQKWDGKKWVSLTKITKNSTTTYTVKSLKASTTYKYRIRAYKTIGKATQYSAYSATLSVNTNPTNMSGYKVKSKTATSVTLQWNKNTSATGYELQKWDGKKWASLTKISKNSTTTYTIKGLKASTTYKYRIRAYKTIGKATQYSSYKELSVNTNPSNMSGFKAKSTAKTSVTLQWNKNTSATGYEIQKWNGKKWVSAAKVTKNSTVTSTVKNLKKNTSYKFRIRAYKTIGKTTQYSSWSSTLTVKTKK